MDNQLLPVMSFCANEDVLEKNRYIWLFFGFSGRISRAPFFLASMLLAIAQAFPLYHYVLAAEMQHGNMDLWESVFWLVFLPSLWGYVALGVKRFHDFGKAGLFAILLFIPIVSLMVFIALCLFPGQSEGNQYGRETNTA